MKNIFISSDIDRLTSTDSEEAGLRHMEEAALPENLFAVEEPVDPENPANPVSAISLSSPSRFVTPPDLLCNESPEKKIVLKIYSKNSHKEIKSYIQQILKFKLK